LLHLVGSSILLYLIDDARTNTNQIHRLPTAPPPLPLIDSDVTKCCIYTIRPPEDEHIIAETCRGI